MQKKKILLIEDEPVLGEILLKKLIEAGYDATWMHDGEKGLAAMRVTRPDMILLDIVMPVKDGYQVLEEMAADNDLRSIPVVVISNSGQPVEIERILGLGVKDYIVKAQFDPDEVLEKVTKFIGGRPEEVAGTSATARSNIRILVIEDDTFLSSLAVGRLQKEGYGVSAAYDGDQGWKALQQDVPDLVLLDFIMPVNSGMNVLKQMRADAKLKDVPVIVFSNGQVQEDPELAALGVEAFLIKANFTLREVVEKIETILKKYGKL